MIHEGAAVRLSDIRSMWADDGLFLVRYPETPKVAKDLMIDVIKEVSTPPNLDQLLVRSLDQWGLEVLSAS
ncbi:hypothetical protein Cylst_2393 [Cylindrospermum stagnale PCC 7417]|uniref:Uncharacterized protein n=1 Tax=Cylindrospermum stagnale PCC 7417 TaxID=56107 RepID=K9WYP3_9NOST|nr:hypothetical protein [Cylindrospermum stagnale]AFZ24612.1 hypothetical protein Cylst_2393 [Cylindrospermum stagnale PCC 7417]